MNEKIKELMLQAGYAAPEIAGRAHVLADLLIKECAQIALKSGNVNNKSNLAKAEAERIYHKINATFGVKDE
jgi:hypothetical protein